MQGHSNFKLLGQACRIEWLLIYKHLPSTYGQLKKKDIQRKSSVPAQLALPYIATIQQQFRAKRFVEYMDR